MYQEVHKQMFYSLFLTFQTQIFIIHFIFNPLIHYSLFSFHPRHWTREWCIILESDTGMLGKKKSDGCSYQELNLRPSDY